MFILFIVLLYAMLLFMERFMFYMFKNIIMFMMIKYNQILLFQIWHNNAYIYILRDG